jgi:hypothetical protein
MVSTHDQYTGIFVGLNLKSVVQRLVGRSKRQAKARCLDKVQLFRFVGAEEFVYKLVLCITALASCCSDPRDVVANFEVCDVGANFQNSSSTIVPNDMKAFRGELVVV